MSISTSVVPAAPPPEGVTPNLEAPRDIYYSANLINTALCLGIVNSAFILHVYVKLVVKRARLVHEDGTFLFFSLAFLFPRAMFRRDLISGC